MQFHITDAARFRLLELLATNDQDVILLSVSSKGCGGNSYQMNFVDSANGETVTLDENHRLIIDQKSVLWLFGTEMDFVDEGLESQFVFANPLATGHCACKKSFTTQTKNKSSR